MAPGFLEVAQHQLVRVHHTFHFDGPEVRNYPVGTVAQTGL